jgi:zinc protease
MAYDLDADYVDEQNDILQSIELDELNTLAQEHLLLDQMIIVVVGDKKSVMPGLEKLGYDIIELDAEANKL